MELAGFIPVVRRWWWLLLAATVAAAGTAYFLASRIPPTYEAEVRLLTGPINTDYSTLRASGELARTYSELAISRPMLRESAKQVGIRRPLEELEKDVAATSNEVTRLVTIRARNSSPEVAAQFANVIARRLTALSVRVPAQQTEAIDEFMRQREISRLPEAAQDQVRVAATRAFGRPYAGRLEVVDPAVRPTEAVAPRITLITVLAALAGLLAAGIFILVRESSVEVVESEETLADAAEVPFLGAVDGFRRGARALVVEERPESDAADAYRVLATKIGFSDGGRPVRTLLVVGSEDGDETGPLAANLAAVLAETEAHVTLVDADAAEGEVTKFLGLGELPGYGDLVGPDANGGSVDEVLVSRNEYFDIVPRGAAHRGPLELERARGLLAELLERSDLVVLSAPPVDRSAATLVWARLADATVVVARRGKTTREGVVEAIQTLRQVGANVIGTVLREGGRLGGRR